jgi:hypothetical protein
MSAVMQGKARRLFRLWTLALGCGLGCASAPPPVPGVGSTVLLAFDDGKVDGAIAFPSGHHESVVRFELPPGEHRLGRLWIRVTAPGTLHWALYDQTPLEGPGQLLSEGHLPVAPAAVSNGRDNRWSYVDLSALPAHDGVLWLGLKRVEGDPTIAASRADAGQYYLRNDDPVAPLNLMPVKRTPLVRLEITP